MKKKADAKQKADTPTSLSYGSTGKDSFIKSLSKRFGKLLSTPKRLHHLMIDKVAELKNWYNLLNQKADENAKLIERMIELWTETNIKEGGK